MTSPGKQAEGNIDAEERWQSNTCSRKCLGTPAQKSAGVESVISTADDTTIGKWCKKAKRGREQTRGGKRGPDSSGIRCGHTQKRGVVESGTKRKVGEKRGGTDGGGGTRKGKGINARQWVEPRQPPRS